MKVSELIEKLKEMPDGCFVYLQDSDGGLCHILRSVEYSDSLGDEDGPDETDGVILSSVHNHPIIR